MCRVWLVMRRVREVFVAMTIEQYLRLMQHSFVPERTLDKRAVFQYVFSGSNSGICHAVVDRGTLRTGMGPHPAPTATVCVDFDLWMRILSYQLDGLLAYQDGRYNVTGDVDTLMEGDTWFRRA